MAADKDKSEPQPTGAPPTDDAVEQSKMQQHYERSATFAGRAGKQPPAPVTSEPQANSTFASRGSKQVKGGESKAVQSSENK